MLNDSTTSLATWVYAIHRSLTEQGYNANQIMLDAGFDFSTLKSTTQRIPKSKLNDIWEAAEQATGDDAFCLSTFSHLNDPYLNALITSAQSSSSIHQAIQLLLRYYRVVTSGSKLEVAINKTVELRITDIDKAQPVSSQDVDLIFGLIYKYGSVLPVKEIHPDIIYMKRKTPKNITAYKEHYDCPIVFGAEANVLHFSLDVLKADIPSANPSLSNHVEQYLAEQMQMLDDSNIAESVQRALIVLLPNGTPKLKDIAERLKLSERTLQRKLQHDKVSFTDLLNNVRIELAYQYLKQPQHSIQKIAYQLGFSEPGNFIRFFKQHTGQTPNAFAKSGTN